MASIVTNYLLQHEDGSAVTAQEVYDALMSGPVWVITDEANFIATGFVWRDSNGGVDDATDVGVVMIEADEQRITVGDSSLFNTK